jgi:hypothetical protein
MTCAEVLASLSTESLRDMPADSAVMSHCATCPECSRVTTLLREKEYEAATLLNGLPPMSSPITLAERSVLTSKRRRVGRVAVIVTGAALVATIWITASLTIVPRMNEADVRAGSELYTETMQLSCLSPQQAADIINPYVRSQGSAYYLPSSGISAITVRGNGQELGKARELISKFERDPGAACRVNVGADGKSITDPVTHPAVVGKVVGEMIGAQGANAPPPAKGPEKIPQWSRVLRR